MKPWPFNNIFLADITKGVRSTTQQDILEWAAAGKTRAILGPFVSYEIDTDCNYKRLKFKLGNDKSKWPRRVAEWADTAAEMTAQQVKNLNCQTSALDLRQRKRVILAIHSLVQNGSIPGRVEEDDSIEERKWRFQTCLRLLLTCLVDIEENPGQAGFLGSCGISKALRKQQRSLLVLQEHVEDDFAAYTVDVALARNLVVAYQIVVNVFDDLVDVAAWGSLRA